MISPDDDNWGKLKKVIKYLNGTKQLKLILLADNRRIIHWYIDSSYGIDVDCRGHTSAMLAFGSGAIT